MATLYDLLKMMIEKKASDLHITTGSSPRLRIDGKLASIDHPSLAPADTKALKCYRGKGCSVCNGSGYKGRIALYEVMPVGPEIKELVLEGASADEIKRTAVKLGMRTLRMSGVNKIKEGTTSVEEVLRVTFGD